MNKQEYMDKLIEALSSFDEDVKNEIVSDYEDHFSEGLSNGKTEEQIVEELGSIDELVAELKDLKGEKKENAESKTISFDSEEISKTVNEVAKGIATLLGTVAATITKGAEKVGETVSNNSGNLAEEFVQGFNNVSDKVINKTKAFAEEVASSYKNERGETVSESEKVEIKEGEDRQVEDVTKLNVEADCGDIYVKDSEDGKVHVSYTNYGTANQKLAYRFNSYQKGNTFYVEVKKQPGSTSFFKSLACPKIDIELAIPANFAETHFKTVSGDLECTGVSVGKMTASSVSGDVNIKNSGFETLQCNSVSGDVSITGVNADIISAKTVSGDVEAEANARECKADSTSGDVDIKGKGYEKVDAHALSGDVDIVLLENDGYTASVSSGSGDITLRYGVSSMDCSKKGNYVMGNGNTIVNATSLSGDVKVNA